MAILLVLYAYMADPGEAPSILEQVCSAERHSSNIGKCVWKSFSKTCFLLILWLLGLEHEGENGWLFFGGLRR